MIDEKNITKAGEVLTHDDAEVSRLLRGLKRVSAPPDFDVRVRARIASGRPQETSTVGFPLFARYAAAFGAIILFAGLLGVVWIYKGTTNSGTTVAGPAPITNPSQVVAANNSVMVADIPTKTPGDDRAGISPSLPSGNPRTQTKDMDRDIVPANSISPDGAGGSKTEARREAKRVLPKGIDPNAPRVQKPKEFDDAPQTPATDIFSLLGVDAKFSNNSWRVGLVKPSTTAERVGVKTGDIIEAVNDQPIKRTTSFPGAFTVKSIRVNRDGKIVNIPLTVN